jgi:hypothetical protein
MTGFIRSIKLMRTSDIPFLNSTELAESSSSSSHYSSSSPSTSSLPGRSGSHQGGLSGQRGRGREREGESPQHDFAELTSPLGTGAGAGVNAAERGRSTDGFREQPMFDPKVIDMDASTILR